MGDGGGGGGGSIRQMCFSVKSSDSSPMVIDLLSTHEYRSVLFQFLCGFIARFLTNRKLQLCSPNLAAEVGLWASAKLAVSALWNVEWNDMVAYHKTHAYKQNTKTPWVSYNSPECRHECDGVQPKQKQKHA